MSDEKPSESKRAVRKDNLGSDPITSSARTAFERQQEQYRQVIEKALAPSRAIDEAVRGITDLGTAREALLGFDSSLITRKALGIDESMMKLAGIAESFDPMRHYRDVTEDSALSRIQNQMREITESSGISKMLADFENTSASTKDSFKFDLPDMTGITGTETEKLSHRVPEIPTYAKHFMDHEPIMPLFHPEQTPGEAATILANLQKDFDDLCEEHANNPSKQPVMIAMLADGTEIYIETACNVGDLSVELTGLEIGTGDRRKLTIGIGAAGFYTDVLDTGKRKPDLRVVEDNDPEDE